ncbi:hypothetical protein F0562_033289 [Nyssa sinensis]|uniref:Uncharacterized protein n=1 Tax=Nyssa sinensis TaxID=561372 RepID=A0A5J5ASD0_9ASTE|nr:hypothetical protein F0562_033289 [Nyssa sinensis]
MSASTSVDDVNTISNASGSMIDKKPASSSIVAATAAGNASGSMIGKIPVSSSIVEATAAVETMEQSERIVSGDPDSNPNDLNSDSSWNFKYSSIEKAIGSLDNANKLGQG